MKKISRRNFLLASGAVTIGAALAAAASDPSPKVLVRGAFFKKKAFCR